MPLFLGGEALKLKLKTQVDVQFLALFAFSIVSSFNWNNPELGLRRKKDLLGKYLLAYCEIPDFLRTGHIFQDTDQRNHY